MGREQEQQLDEHSFCVSAVVFSPDSQLLASASFIGMVGLSVALEARCRCRDVEVWRSGGPM